tara:strand:- start:66 stop:734 length:669 start_codon:yes stop_codon:yes gene_type:complete
MQNPDAGKLQSYIPSRENSFLPKDVYEYLTNFADDKTILNMLMVNKKFQDDSFFHRVLLRKYPYLLEFKGSMTYKQLYTQMVHYISLLEEEHNIPYIPAKDYNPRTMYKGWIDSYSYSYGIVLIWAVKSGNKNLVINIYNKIPSFMITQGVLVDALEVAVEEGRIGIVEFLLSKLRMGENISEYIRIARESGYVDILKLLEEYKKKNYDITDYGMRHLQGIL